MGIGDPTPLPKRGGASQFLAHDYCGQTDQDATWYVGRLGPDYIVLDEDSAPLPKKGAEPLPQFSADVYCGQTAGWIKMALAMEVGLGPSHVVLYGDPASLPKKAEPPISGAFLQRAQCSHCKRCISYSNSLRPSVCLSVRPSVRHAPVLCQTDGT